MKFKQHPPEPDPVERDDVHVATNRCPFCHDAVAVLEDEWVSCHACQARHHRACWEEAGACSSCGGARFLAEASTLSDRPQLGRRGLALGVVGSLIGLAALAVGKHAGAGIGLAAFFVAWFAAALALAGLVTSGVGYARGQTGSKLGLAWSAAYLVASYFILMDGF